MVLGDQLDADSAAFDDFDPARDAVFMAEAIEESRHVPGSRARSTLFLSAMRHFAQTLAARGWRVHYQRLDDPGAAGTLADALQSAVAALAPAECVMVEPGEWRLREAFARHPAAPQLLPDRHFLCSHEDFAAHAKGRRQLRMEFFYREMRERHRVLMDGDAPAGGQWNYDAENRKAFGAAGPKGVPPRTGFAPDAITREVIALLERVLPDQPGSAARFDWPVTREQALATLAEFIERRLPAFGDFQDAMWTGEPWLFHAHVAAALNLRLLDPREVIAAAEAAWREGRAPLPAVEGFIRQVLGWREYVRGIYWRAMPGYLEGNALAAHAPLPAFYWTGETPMTCLREAVGQSLDLGYAHHIQRLMVTGLYALLLGAEPLEVHAWYLSVYVDAVEWVEAPNTLGMALYADGGLMASKPYVATGRYIERMSNYCRGCRYDPAKSVGEDACPFTTLYWDFLARHRATLARNVRMALQLKNLARLDAPTLAAIAARAEAIRAHDGVPPGAGPASGAGAQGDTHADAGRPASPGTNPATDAPGASPRPRGRARATAASTRPRTRRLFE
jgi:deoxyribodipyrimidine photolyase-related protein